MPLAHPKLDSVRYPTDGYTNTNAINPVTPWLLRKPSSLWGRLSATCHPERSEGSRSSDTQILRSAQNDTPLNAFVLDDLGLSGDVVGARGEHVMCSERTLKSFRPALASSGKKSRSMTRLLSVRWEKAAPAELALVSHQARAGPVTQQPAYGEGKRTRNRGVPTQKRIPPRCGYCTVKGR